MNTEQVSSEIGAISTQIVDLEAQLEQLKNMRRQRIYLLEAIQRDSRNQGQVRGDSAGDQPEETG